MRPIERGRRWKPSCSTSIWLPPGAGVEAQGQAGGGGPAGVQALEGEDPQAGGASSTVLPRSRQGGSPPSSRSPPEGPGSTSASRASQSTSFSGSTSQRQASAGGRPEVLPPPELDSGDVPLADRLGMVPVNPAGCAAPAPGPASGRRSPAPAGATGPPAGPGAASRPSRPGRAAARIPAPAGSRGAPAPAPGSG